MMTCDAPHPGAVLRRCMADQISVTDLAEHLGVPRMTLTRLLTGKIRMSASMALNLSEAYPHTDAQRWMDLQTRYELSREMREPRRPIAPLAVSRVGAKKSAP